MKAKVQLSVEGMTCSGCVRSIETALSEIPGVTYAHVNLGDGTAGVDYDDEQTDGTKLLEAVKGLGFQATQC